MLIKKRIVYISIMTIIIGALFAFGRGPYISNSLKKLILPELELMTGKKFIAGKIYVNLFPLFAEMKDVTVFDDEGKKLLSAERVKGYVSLSGLLGKKVVIKRLVIRKTALNFEKSEIEEILENVKKYLAIERKDALKVEIKSVVIDNGLFDLRDGENRIIAKEANAEVLINQNPFFKISFGELESHINGMPQLTAAVEAFFELQKDKVDIKSLKINAYGSQIKTSGGISTNPVSGEIKTEMQLLADSFRKVFGLTKNGEGKISVTGTVKAAGIKSLKDVIVDLKIKGDLYLETLMELLKVKEKLSGHMTINGGVKGAINDIHGEGIATLEKGDLFGVKIDSLNSAINYQDNSLKFINAKASLYGGSATAEAVLALPVVNYYSFKVKGRGLSSKGLFELINWDPGIAEGKVDGEISSEGSSFNPRGVFSYRKSVGGKDILARVSAIDGPFQMSQNVVTLPQLAVSTGTSTFSAAGTVDLNKNTLVFRGTGTTSDVYELTDPYFRGISGPASFNAILSGQLGDPVLDLAFKSNDIKLSSQNLDLSFVRPHTVKFHDVEGDVSYRKDLLIVKRFSAASTGLPLEAQGKIRFPSAKHLFDVISPHYDLQISSEKGDLKDLSSIIKDAPLIKGVYSTSLTMTGIGEQSRVSGTFHGSNVVIADKYSLDNVDSALSFERGDFTFRSLKIKKGPVVLDARGMVSVDKRYVVSATAKSLDVFDVIPEDWREKLKDRNLSAISLSDVSITGQGTFASPLLDVEGTLRYHDPNRQQASGSGRINAKLRGKNVYLSGNLMGGKIKMNGSAALDGTLPWRADIELLSARADFLVAGFLRDIPEDLLINLKGNVRLWGDRNNINGSVMFDKAYIYGYGYGFTNSSPLSVKLQDKMLSIESFSMKSETAELKLKGYADLGKRFNLSLDGASSLAPLRAISKNVDVIKGDASFAMTLTGDWAKPKINGRMDVANGAFGLKSLPHRLTNLTARIYADGDRIIIEEAKGKVSGGDVTLSGSVYLDRLSLKRFFIESKLNNVTASVSKNFWVHFDGNLTYQGSLQNQNVTGEIVIKRARYTERIEWKSWLLQAHKKERPRFDAGRFEQTGLNVRVTGSNLSIDNNVARASMKMDLLLRGTVGQPVILGRLETINGIVYFRNNEFTVLKGVVDFASPLEINPFFDLLAETRIRNYTIRLALDGYIDKFNLSLSSNPGLEEGDILSLLAVGQVGKNLKGLEGGIGAGEATSFLTGKMQDIAEERLKTITGVDRLQIDPSISRTTGTVSPRVTISKKIIGDRLYATYSAAADVGEGQIIKLEYLLNKNTSLVGVRDERGGVGGDIKFRFEFK